MAISAWNAVRDNKFCLIAKELLSCAVLFATLFTCQAYSEHDAWPVEFVVVTWLSLRWWPSKRAVGSSRFDVRHGVAKE